MKKTVLLASLLALAGFSAAASAADTNGWYLRGDLGSARVSASGLGHDDTFGGAARVGYFFNPNFAVEGGYVDFGSHSVFGGHLRVDAWGGGLVAKTHFDQNPTGWYVDGRLGVNRLHASAFGVSGNTTKAYFGIGGGYDFSPNFGLSLNYLYQDSDSSSKAQLLSVGFEGRF